MIRHIFLWKTADSEYSELVSQQLSSLITTMGISAMVGTHVGSGFNGRDWSGGLIADFATEAQLVTFMASPQHRAVVAEIGPRLDDVAILDLDLAVTIVAGGEDDNHR